MTKIEAIQEAKRIKGIAVKTTVNWENRTDFLALGDDRQLTNLKNMNVNWDITSVKIADYQA